MRFTTQSKMTLDIRASRLVTEEEYCRGFTEYIDDVLWYVFIDNVAYHQGFFTRMNASIFCCGLEEGYKRAINEKTGNTPV